MKVLRDNESILLPDWSKENFMGVVNCLAKFIGNGYRVDAPINKMVWSEIENANHLVFILIDGLGYHSVRGLDENSFLSKHTKQKIRSVIPSTTTAALTSLASNRSPNEHSSLSWYRYIQEEDLSLISLPFIERFKRSSLTKQGLQFSDIYKIDSFLQSSNMSLTVSMPSFISDSVYTKGIAGQAKILSYDDIGEAFKTIQPILKKQEKSYHYVYFPNYDSISHEFGCNSPEALQCITDIDKKIEKFSKIMGDNCKILITADHGQIETEENKSFILSEQDELMQYLVCPPTGEPRMPFFHVKEGIHEKFKKSFQDRFGNNFALLNRTEVENLNLFGLSPYSGEILSAIGDYIAIPNTKCALFYEENGQDPEIDFGVHGGLHKDEMEIPVIIY